MRKSHALCLILLAALVTGCPYNNYVVELTPHGKTIQRKLEFYCQDGVETNGFPKYQAFSQVELGGISRFYLAGQLKKDGDRHTATGEFSGAMPNDVGGSGSYTFLTNSLGGASFYIERFRGSDDIAARAQLHLKTADKLVDYIIGWSQKEFGGERHYQDLRRFLNGEFRQDMRNMSLHAWMLQNSMNSDTPAPEEFGLRFAQYLAERGYFRTEDVPDIARAFIDKGDSRPVLRLVRQLVARKLKVPAGKPMPATLAFLADPDKITESWEDYLATTTEYRTKLRRWQMKRVTAEAGIVGNKVQKFLHARSATNAPPALPDKPSPSEVTDELLGQLMEFDLWQTDDHLSVRLQLPAAPTHTNGKWDDAAKQVVWDAHLGERTNAARLPAFCYASWSEPNEEFQRAHFGSLVLKGDELLQYSVWRNGLDAKRSKEWDALIAGLQPDNQLLGKLVSFQFSDESPLVSPQPQNPGPADFPRQLFKAVLENKAVAEKK